MVGVVTPHFSYNHEPGGEDPMQAPMVPWIEAARRWIDFLDEDRDISCTVLNSMEKIIEVARKDFEGYEFSYSDIGLYGAIALLFVFSTALFLRTFGPLLLRYWRLFLAFFRIIVR